MKLVDSGEMSRIDRVAQDKFHIDGILLMENAGIKAFQRFCRMYKGSLSRNSRLVFVVGKGNNGGDALVMARQALCRFSRVSVVIAGQDFGESVSRHVAAAEAYGVPVHQWNTDKSACEQKIGEADVVFDGLFGIGLSGELRPAARPLVDAVNRSRAVTVAIDVPSGIGDGFRAGRPCVRADATLTLGLPKRCLFLPAARPHCGRIEIVPIGFPRALVEDEQIAAELLDHADLRSLGPHHGPEAYKGTRGALAVFAGSAGTTGAASLAALAGARSGAGMCTLFAERSVFKVMASHSLAVMTRPWEADSKPAELGLERFDAFVVGPGWGFDRRLPWLEALVASGRPGVLDADGLTLLSKNRDTFHGFGGRWVLTPHPGEFARLSGGSKQEALDRPYELIGELSEDLQAVVVLKSHVTFISEPGGRISIVDGMNPALGTGGAGDILAGLIGGYLAQGLSPYDAARCGVLVHDKVGKLAYREAGWFLSEDLLGYISRVAAMVGGG